MMNAKSLIKARAAAGTPLDEDGRKYKALAPHTIQQLDAVRAILNPQNPISVRSCCYHLLSLGLLSSTKDFSNMGKKITDARLRDEDDPNSLRDDCFVDHSRVLEWVSGWSNVNTFLRVVKDAYSRDPWQDQTTIPIILCEKRGHGDILKTTCDAEHVRLFLSKGIHARSFLCSIAQHCADVLTSGKSIHLGYLGDFDCSGLRMEVCAEHGNEKAGVSRREGLRQILMNKHEFTEDDLKERLQWTRLALTKEQFKRLPKSARVPVKVDRYDEDGELVKGDNNAPAYIAEHGKFGGEVEALGFERLQGLVKEFIDSKKNKALWEEGEHTQQGEIDALSNVTL